MEQTTKQKNENDSYAEYVSDISDKNETIVKETSINKEEFFQNLIDYKKSIEDLKID